MSRWQHCDDGAADDSALPAAVHDDIAEADAVLSTDFARYFLSLPDPPDSCPEPDPTPWELEEQSRTTAGADQLAARAAHLEPGERTAQILAVLNPAVLSAGGMLDAVRAAERLASWNHATQLRHLAAFACPGVAARSDDLTAYASAPGQPLHSPKPAGSPPDHTALDDLPTSGPQIHGDRQRNLTLMAVAHKVAAAEVSAALLISPLNAGRRVAQATTYVDELPSTLRALRDGIIDRGRAMVIADRTQNLPTDLRHRVEEAVIGKAGHRTAGQLRAITDRAVIAVDPEAAKKRHDIAKKNRGVSLRPDEDGMSQVRADLTADKACTAFNLIDQIAMFNSRDTTEHRPIGALRADAFADIFDQLTDHGTVDLHHLLSSRDNTPTETPDHGTDETATTSRAATDPPVSDTTCANQDDQHENPTTANNYAERNGHRPADTDADRDTSTTTNDRDEDGDERDGNLEASNVMCDRNPSAAPPFSNTDSTRRANNNPTPPERATQPAPTTDTQSQPANSTKPESAAEPSTEPESQPADSTGAESQPSRQHRTRVPASRQHRTRVPPADSTEPGSQPADSTESESQPANSTDTESRPADSTEPGSEPTSGTEPVSEPTASTTTSTDPEFAPTVTNSGTDPQAAVENASRLAGRSNTDSPDTGVDVAIGRSGSVVDPANGVDDSDDQRSDPPTGGALPSRDMPTTEAATATCSCGQSPSPDHGLQRGLGTHQGRPTNLNITMAATTLAGLDDLPAELDGHGPIHPDIARALLASAATITAVAVNPTCGTALDLGRTIYRPRLAQRDYVTKRDQTCRFPSCRQPSWRCQIDHSNEFCPGSSDSGVTCPCNLTCLCKFHHDLKTFRLWDTEHHPDGSITWTSPIGRTYTTQTRQWLTGMTDTAPATTETEKSSSAGADVPDPTEPTATTNIPDILEPPF